MKDMVGWAGMGPVVGARPLSPSHNAILFIYNNTFLN